MKYAQCSSTSQLKKIHTNPITAFPLGNKSVSLHPKTIEHAELRKKVGKQEKDYKPHQWLKHGPRMSINQAFDEFTSIGTEQKQKKRGLMHNGRQKNKPLQKVESLHKIETN
ncbi:hypothetical protein TWF102_002101 [Orbilia oligospora]|uniref:Uncharacterized protein n=1 Tax=Orbilia oligospora TaxID=2813651 RepID=A0A7C8J0L4_ORBOL|nr:hypothetical protein TWF102_002101 [Orbilia oligospora]KAF3083786.1 hypothetical protein TWF103_002717 [Orbilia oligospora]KAF3112153.1 hypothetical protein TWF706_010760 [Orbilia oligospora]